MFLNISSSGNMKQLLIFALCLHVIVQASETKVSEAKSSASSDSADSVANGVDAKSSGNSSVARVYPSVPWYPPSGVLVRVVAPSMWQQQYLGLPSGNSPLDSPKNWNLDDDEDDMHYSNVELGLLQTWEKESLTPYLKKPSGYRRTKYNFYGVRPSSTRVYTLVLSPGDEIISALRRFAKQQRLKAVYIITCVAGINEITLRYALNPKTNNRTMETIQKELELTSLTGTIAADGSGYHLHATMYDEFGKITGGHVAGDIVVSVTAEIVLGEVLNSVFTRRPRPSDGLSELIVSKRY